MVAREKGGYSMMRKASHMSDSAFNSERFIGVKENLPMNRLKNNTSRRLIRSKKKCRKSCSQTCKSRKLHKTKSSGCLDVPSVVNFDASKYTSFNDAYRALTKKMMSCSIDSSYMVPHSASKSYHASDPGRFNRLHNERLGKVVAHVKDDSMYKVFEDEKELTFHPKIDNPFNKKRRSAGEFVNDMVSLHFNNRLRWNLKNNEKRREEKR